MQTEEPTTDRNRKYLKVLLIEDDPDDLLIIQELLEEIEDPQVTVRMEHAADLSDGLAKLADGKTDAVLLDLNLPESQGIETLGIFKEEHPTLPVVVLTTYKDSETALSALRKGANDYLVKGDFNSLLLHRTIRYAIERQELLVRIEDDLKRQHQESEMQLLKEINKELSLKNKELANAYRFKSEFLANVSHELKTPLNSILAAIDLLKESNLTLSESQSKYVQLITKNGKDLLELINDILDESKMESGKLEIVKNKITVHDMAESMRSIFTDIASKKSIEFTVTIDKEVPVTITSDQLRLEQILKNLLSNAFKFTNPGGRVEMIVSVADPTMKFNSVHLNEYSREVILFSVKDSGLGIPEDKQEMIFKAFQQLDSSTSRIFGGSGLGLSISNSLSNLLEGELSLESKPGEGSTFTLYIPKDL